MGHRTEGNSWRARRTKHRTFRPTHGKQTAYHATITSAYVYSQCMHRTAFFAKTRPYGPPTAKRGFYVVMFKYHVYDVTSCVGAWSTVIVGTSNTG